MKDLTLPPLPEIPKSEIIPYSAIRYVAGYTESFVHKYAQDYARAALASHHADAQPKTAKCQSCKGTGFDKLATPEQKWPWCEKCSGSGKLPIKCAALSHHEDGGRAATDKKSARDTALEQAANLVECEYAENATQDRRLKQIAQHIRDLKKRNQS